MTPPKEYIWLQFEAQKDAIHKQTRATYKYCRYQLVKQAIRAQKHLEYCNFYEAYYKNLGRSIEKIDQYQYRYIATE